MVIKGILAIKVSYQLHRLEEYLKTTEKYLQKAKLEFETWADKQAKKLAPEQHEEFNEFYTDEYWYYSEIFPRILRNSFLVSAHSLLEHEMGRICERLKREKKLPIGWRDLKYDVLERFKLYCNLAGLPLSYDDLTWQRISNYYMIRNCIVHNNGLIKGVNREQQLRAYVARRNLISHDTIQEEIALTEKFCEEVIKTIQAFLMKTYEAYYDELQRQKQKPDS